jgi:hypothetical protein
MVASADGEAMEAQFRRLREEIAAAPSVFGDLTIGHMAAEALSADLDGIWDAYQAAGQSPRDGLKRAIKALRRVPDPESRAYRHWLLTLAMQIADATRSMGDPRVSPNEAEVIRVLAESLDEPEPDVSAS